MEVRNDNTNSCSGLVLGCVYGLIALGYSLIYKASGMLNFTQGDILTLGAFLDIPFMGFFHIPFILTVIIVFIIMLGFGMVWRRASSVSL